MTYRFEVEEFLNTYILEDYYCTNPFCECNHVTISLSDQENTSNRLMFLLNFNNKTHGLLPDAPKPDQEHTSIIKEFIGNIPEEQMVLFKQRYMEAKAFGEGNPMSYLIFEPGRYYNFMELIPRNTQMLDFSLGEDKYFAEDSYEIDPRNDNRDVKLAFFKLELDNENQPPKLNYTYFFNEKLREKEDAKLEAEQNDMVLAFNRGIPGLYDLLKKRYKEAKDLGASLMKGSPGRQVVQGKIKPNDPCPCGSGKKFKKCCALKMN